MSLNAELANLFQTAANVLDIKGGNPFRAISFAKVARILEDTTEDVRALVEAGTLEKVNGIGSSSGKMIEEYVKTGRSADYEELLATIPPGLPEMLNIQGLGPKTVSLLWHERQIESIDDLAKAIDAGKLEGVKGIGAKKIEAMKEGIALRLQAAERRGLPEAMKIAAGLRDKLLEMDQVERVEFAGSLRRGRETIGDVDLLCVPKGQETAAITAAFAGLPGVEKVLVQGETKTSILTAGGLQVDLRVVPKKCFGAAWLYFTGSKDHNTKLRSRAQDRKLTLNEWGLYDAEQFDKTDRTPGRVPDLKAVAGATEIDVYEKLGLDFIPPELREGRGEIQQAADHALPNLITLADLRGDLHTHTVASDGGNTILEMAERANELGFAYLGITDHSKSQTIANGLDAARLLKHAAAVRDANEQIKGIELLAGSECDILSDGSMDYEDAVLAELDFVVASPHTALKQDAEKATARLLRAIDNRYVTIVGHPTGRYINRRPGLPIDLHKVAKAAAASGTALEINASWPRLDLSDVHARIALEAGCALSINTDSHSTTGLGGAAHGITVARRAGAEKKDVINCLTAAALKKFIAQKRGS